MISQTQTNMLGGFLGLSWGMWVNHIGVALILGLIGFLFTKLLNHLWNRYVNRKRKH